MTITEVLEEAEYHSVPQMAEDKASKLNFTLEIASRMMVQLKMMTFLGKM